MSSENLFTLRDTCLTFFIIILKSRAAFRQIDIKVYNFIYALK